MFELNKLKRKFYLRIPILIGLLLCLCFSQGEGVRLLPFEIQTSPDAFDVRHNATYQLSTHQQISGVNFQAKNIKSAVKFISALSFSNTRKHFSSVPYSETFSDAPKPKVTISKFLQTASSDRSPPFKG